MLVKPPDTTALVAAVSEERSAWSYVQAQTKMYVLRTKRNTTKLKAANVRVCFWRRRSETTFCLHITIPANTRCKTVVKETTAAADGVASFELTVGAQWNADDHVDDTQK